MFSLPPLPMPIRILRDTVGVLILIVAGGTIAALPYQGTVPDPRMVQVFEAVFGTLGFAASAYFAPARRGLHVTLTALAVWLIAGVEVAVAGADPVWWIFVLAALALMALIGGGMAKLAEKLIRD